MERVDFTQATSMIGQILDKLARGWMPGLGADSYVAGG
jgi:hypothetical protein